MSGWHTERSQDIAARWAYESVICEYHGVRHLEDEPCPICEDGEEFHEWTPHGRYRGRPEEER